MGVCCEASIYINGKQSVDPGAKHNDYDVVCQRHLTDSDYRPTMLKSNIDFISLNINALLWLFVICIDTLLVNFNEIKRNVIT